MRRRTNDVLKIAFYVLLLSSIGLSQQPSPKPAMQWDEMVWISLPVGDGTVEKAVLAIHMAIEGLQRPALMQLDLGTYQTIVYGIPYHALGGRPEASPASRITASGTVAGLRFQAEVFDWTRNKAMRRKRERLRNWALSVLTSSTTGFCFSISFATSWPS